ncbi:condensation domain-containing protein, partial [Mesorhizobium mediterraneum]|uniref:condensation domain-containing protein n=1 Tax=Mesorhizobium mediterraneum TaxID=43617 RepID=UPI001FEE797A
APYVAPRTPIQDLLAGIWANVLGVERVGADDNFFDLGGHSLTAMQVASRIEDALRTRLPLRLVFERPTVAGLAQAVEGNLQANPPPPLVRASREHALPLSFAQQRLWFLDQLDPGGSSYNCAGALRLLGDLDCAALQRSFTVIVERHEALRTIFREGPHGAEQLVLPAGEFALELREACSEAEAVHLASEHARRPFDLRTGPLIRASVIRLGQRDHILLLSLHHIASDGWSLALLFRELAVVYRSIGAGTVAALTPLPIQYADYAVWQRGWLQGEVVNHQLAYWAHQLRHAPELSTLPADRPRPTGGAYRGARRLIQLDPLLSREVHAFSRCEGATVFMTLLAAFQALVFRHTGQPDLVVGAPIAGRNRRELEGLIGFFVNTLALRCDFSGDPSSRQLLARVRDTVLGAYTHQDVSFEQIVGELRPERTLSHTPLFQLMFDYLDASVQAPDFLGLATSPLEVDSGTAKFDLTLVLGDTPQGLSGSIEYATDLFDPDSIDRLARHFEVLLAAMVRHPELRLSQLPLMDAGERRQILGAWAGTGAGGDGVLVPQRFEDCARRWPDRIAVVAGDQQVTYG